MRLTLIALLLAGVEGCDSEPDDRAVIRFEEPKPETENGGDEEPESGFEATLKAAEQGDAEAQYDLGRMYLTGIGVPGDKAEAVKWTRKAAEQGHARAQFQLGFAYDLGEGVPEDNTESVKWYRKAAKQGDARAQFQLGLAYDFGEGVPKDATEAAKWYRKAAE